MEAGRYFPDLETDLRILAYVADRGGEIQISTRGLSIEISLDRSALVRAYLRCEDHGWLDIEHGHSHLDEEEAEANAYTVTESGRAQIPDLLATTRLIGPYALTEALWSTRGVGMAGLLLSIAQGRSGPITSQNLADVLGIDRRSASKRLSRWSDKGCLVLRKNRTTYLLLHPDGQPFVPPEIEDAIERRRASLEAEQDAFRANVEDTWWGYFSGAAARASREAGQTVMAVYLDLIEIDFVAEPIRLTVSSDGGPKRLRSIVTGSAA